MSLLPAITRRRCRFLIEIDENPGQGVIPGVNNTGKNLSPVKRQFIASVVDTGYKRKVENISANVIQCINVSQCDSQGPKGKWFIKKSEVENLVSDSL